MIGDSQTPYFSVVKNTTAVVAIADWTNNAFRGVDEISTHNSPPRGIGGGKRRKERDLSVTGLAKRSKKSPTQSRAVFIETPVAFIVLEIPPVMTL